MCCLLQSQMYLELDFFESARTTYFIIKGAALINVVANIKENYFPIKWNSDVSKMTTITVEALVRSDDWVAKRDNALSSVLELKVISLYVSVMATVHVINFRHLCRWKFSSSKSRTVYWTSGRRMGTHSCCV